MVEREIALQSAIASIDKTRTLLNRCIKTTSSILPPEETSQLKRAALRTLGAMDNLREFLASPSGGLGPRDLEEDGEAPRMDRSTATRFLRDLDALIVMTEKEILQAVEQVLVNDELRDFRRGIGQLWGWIVCDLQDPLWRQYPDLGPKKRQT